MIPFVIFAATAQPITFQGSAPVGKAMAPDQAGPKSLFSPLFPTISTTISRYAFVLEALPMIPFVFFAATAQPITFQGSAPVGKAMAPDQAGPKSLFSPLFPTISTTISRYAFVLEALPMIPFVIFAATAQPITFQGSAPVGKAMAPDQAGAKHGFLHPLAVLKNDVKVVMSQRVYATICPAYTAYVAVLGVYAFWGPQAGKALFFDVDDDSSDADLAFGGMTAGKALFFDVDDDSSDADLAFGGMTVLTGIAGSLAGGFLLDRVGSTLVNANIICATSCIVGCFFALIAFIFTQTFAQFMTFFALGQLAMFALQAPIAGMIMWTVPRSLRPMATSLMTVYIHLLGDVPSPPLLGLLQSYLSRTIEPSSFSFDQFVSLTKFVFNLDQFRVSIAQGKSIEEAAQQWRWSMSIITTLLLLAGMLFFVAAKLVTPRSDYRRDGEASPEDPDEAPLLPAPGATSDEE
eukprot:gene6590-3244_t